MSSERVYCIVCDAWVLKTGLKKWTGDDALHFLCPHCDTDLMPVEHPEVDHAEFAAVETDEVCNE